MVFKIIKMNLQLKIANSYEIPAKKLTFSVKLFIKYKIHQLSHEVSRVLLRLVSHCTSSEEYFGS